MKYLLFVVLLPFASLAQGNEKQTKRLNLHTITSVGFTAGEYEVKPLVQFSAGVKLHSLFAGAGAGMDFYRVKSIPVFADLRYSFGKQKQFFVYGNGGYNFPFNYKPKMQWWGQISDDVSGGIYMDGGIGLNMPAGKKHSFGFSVGMSRKSIVNTTRTSTCAWGGCPTINDLKTEYKHVFSRFVSKLSWRFGK